MEKFSVKYDFLDFLWGSRQLSEADMSSIKVISDKVSSLSNLDLAFKALK